MTITTKFNLGDQVLSEKSPLPICIGEIKIRRWQYDGEILTLIEYRSAKRITNEAGTYTVNGPWFAEHQLKLVTD